MTVAYPVVDSPEGPWPPLEEQTFCLVTMSVTQPSVQGVYKLPSAAQVGYHVSAPPYLDGTMVAGGQAPRGEAGQLAGSQHACHI